MWDLHTLFTFNKRRISFISQKGSFTKLDNEYSVIESAVNKNLIPMYRNIFESP